MKVCQARRVAALLRFAQVKRREDPKNRLSGRSQKAATVVQGTRYESPLIGALTHWLSACLSSRTKGVRFSYASPPTFCTAGAIWQTRLAQTQDVLRSNRRRCTSRFVPVVQSVDAASLNLVVMHVQLVPGIPTVYVRMAQSGRRARSRVSMLQVQLLLRTPQPSW